MTTGDIALVVTALASLIAAIAAVIGVRKTSSLHVDIDGRMEQLLEARGEAAEAKGVAKERQETRDRSVSEAEDAARVRDLNSTSTDHKEPDK